MSPYQYQWRKNHVFYAWNTDPPPTNDPVGGYQPPVATARRSGLAIAALVLGIVSLVLCWVPILNNLILIVAIVGLALGIAAIIITKKKQATRSGFGMALVGTILSVVAIIGVIVTQSIYVKVVDEVIDELDSPSVSSTESGATSNEATESKDETTNTESDTSTQTEDSGIKVELVSLAPAGPDFEGTPTVMLTYTVTNNTDENYSVMSLDATAFQNGTSLDDFPVYSEEPEGYDSQSQMQDIQPGATGTVTKTYKLQDETSPVEVQVEDLFDFSGNSEPIKQEFPLQ